MPKISVEVDSVQYVISGWTTFELNRKEIEFRADGGVPMVTNNEYVCDIIYRARKQLLGPLHKALSLLRERLEDIENMRSNRESFIVGISSGQVLEFDKFMESETWPVHAKHVLKFMNAMASEFGVTPSEPIPRVDPFRKEKVIDPTLPKSRKSLEKKFAEYERLLGLTTQYISDLTARI